MVKLVIFSWKKDRGKLTWESNGHKTLNLSEFWQMVPWNFSLVILYVRCHCSIVMICILKLKGINKSVLKIKKETFPY